MKCWKFSHNIFVWGGWFKIQLYLSTLCINFFFKFFPAPFCLFSSCRTLSIPSYIRSFNITTHVLKFYCLFSILNISVLKIPTFSFSVIIFFFISWCMVIIDTLNLSLMIQYLIHNNFCVHWLSFQLRMGDIILFLCIWSNFELYPEHRELHIVEDYRL
jgi:hypothetical protein